MIKMKRLLALSVVASLGALSSAVEGPPRGNIAEPEHRRLREAPEGRHNQRPKNKSAGPPHYATTQYNYLMESNCRPKDNGFFGSTGGKPAQIQYGFLLETTVFANIDRILDIVNEHIMDAVLEETFAQQCGVASRRLLLAKVKKPGTSGHITGFKFSTDLQDHSLTCDPTIHVKNTCGYFSSTIKVYGADLNTQLLEETLEHIRTALPGSLLNAAKRGAVRLEIADGLTTILSNPGSGLDGDGGAGALSPSAKAGIVIAVLVLLSGVGVLYVYFKVERQEKENHPYDYTKKKKSIYGKDGSFRRFFENDGSRTYRTGTESDFSDEIAYAKSFRNGHQITKGAPHRPTYGRQQASRHLSKEASRHLANDELEDIAHPADLLGPNRLQRRRDIHQHPPPDWDNNTPTRQERPVIVEFGPSFDPERDRYLKDLEIESSKPPEFIYWDPELVVSENLRII